MKTSTEEKIDKVLGKKEGDKLKQEIKENVQKEVKKRLSRVVYEKSKKSAVKFGKEFKQQTAIAITAAFAFLIALSWRTPIQNLVDLSIDYFGLTGKAIYIEFFSAILLTLIAVLVLMWFSKEEGIK